VAFRHSISYFSFAPQFWRIAWLHQLRSNSGSPSNFLTPYLARVVTLPNRELAE